VSGRRRRETGSTYPSKVGLQNIKVSEIIGCIYVYLNWTTGNASLSPGCYSHHHIFLCCEPCREHIVRLLGILILNIKLPQKLHHKLIPLKQRNVPSNTRSGPISKLQSAPTLPRKGPNRSKHRIHIPCPLRILHPPLRSELLGIDSKDHRITIHSQRAYSEFCARGEEVLGDGDSLGRCVAGELVHYTWVQTACFFDDCLQEGEFETLCVRYWAGEGFRCVVLVDLSLETLHVLWMTD